MKKVFSSMVLAALAASLAWAQDGTVTVSAGELKISGDVKVGLRADGDLRKQWDPSSKPGEYDEKDATTNIYGRSDDADDDSALRADLTAAYTNGPFGFKINLRSSSWTPVWGGTQPGVNAKGDASPNNEEFTSFSNHTYISSAYGWVDLFNNKVSVSGGLIGDDIWGTASLGDTATDTSFDDVGGLRLAIKPIEALWFGLSLPFGATIDSQLGKGIDGTKYYRLYGASEDAAGNPFLGNTAFDLFAHSVIGVGFKNDAFAANVSVKLNGGFYNKAIKSKAFDADAKEDTYYGFGPDILFGAKLTAVPKLLIVVDGKLTNLFQSEDFYWAAGNVLAATPDKFEALLPTYDIYLKAQYDILEALTAGLRLQVTGVSGTGVSDIDEAGTVKDASKKENQFAKTDIGIRVFADYAVTPSIKPGLELEFYIKGNDALAEKNYEDGTDDAKKMATHAGLSHIYFKPRCAFSLGEGLTFKVWDKITLVMANGLDNDEYYTDATYGKQRHSGKSPKDAKELAGFVTNSLQLDFVWAF